MSEFRRQGVVKRLKHARIEYELGISGIARNVTYADWYTEPTATVTERAPSIPASDDWRTSGGT